MNVNTYLNFDGRCNAALKFYEEALGAKTMFKMTVGESPMAKDMPD
jgi:PhnB protein